MSDTRAVRQVEEIRKVVEILDKDWIVEGCGDAVPNMTCASCRAIGIRRDLQMLALAIYENDALDPSMILEW